MAHPPIPNKLTHDTAPFQKLLRIMDELRENCPWDKKQTLESLRYLTIEETYELSDAIMTNDLPSLKGEIGDLLLHLCFYSRIASEQGAFDINDVIEAICQKLIHRHPHIYSNVQVENEEDVKANWEKLKLKEGKKSVLEGVPQSLPAMVKAARIQEKVRGVGFDWENKEQVWNKLQEELEELKVEVADQNKEKMEAELGDVLFSVINYARFIGINPEDALEKTNRKFIQRFQYLENASKEDGKELGSMKLAEMDQYWNESKKLIP
jgi:XTP/dITP diphosphohydrolase